MDITIIGCGHGGQAMAAHLSIQKNSVTLYADIDHPGAINNIHQNTISIDGKINGLAKIHRVTTDIQLALSDAQIIYIILPTHAHLSQFQKMLPYLKTGQIVVTLAGNFSSLYFYHELFKQGRQNDIYLADLASLPYACRSDKPGQVTILDIKKSMDIAAMPSINTKFIADLLAPHFPASLSPRKNVIELGFNIISAIIHPVITLTNAGRIGPEEEEFYFYKEGISHETSKIIEQLDKDRQCIAREYGFELPSFLENMASFYTVKYTSVYDFFTQSTVHNKQKLCPKSVKERYIIQDVPYVIVPWLNLGIKAGYISPVMRAIVDIASTLTQHDYYTCGRSVADDFFTNMTMQDISEFMSLGNIPKSALKI